MTKTIRNNKHIEEDENRGKEFRMMHNNSQKRMCFTPLRKLWPIKLERVMSEIRSLMRLLKSSIGDTKIMFGTSI